MARPIKETPVLTGRDAELFIENMDNVKRASDSEIAEAHHAYEAFKAISTFKML